MSFNPFEWFQKTITGIWQGITNMPNMVVSGIGQAVNNVTAPIASAFQQIGNWIMGGIENLANSIWGTIQNIGNGIGQGLAWLGSSIFGALQSLANTIVSGVTGGLQWLWNNLTNALRNAGQWILDQLRNIGQFFMEPLHWLLNAVLWLPQTLWNMIKSGFGKLQDFLWRSVVDVVLANLPAIFAMFYLGQSMKHVHKYATSPRKLLTFMFSPFAVYMATQLALGLAGVIFKPPQTVGDYNKAINAPKAYANTTKTLSVKASASYKVTLIREFEVPIQTVGKARLMGFEAKTPTVSYTVMAYAYSGSYGRGNTVSAQSTVVEGAITAALTAMQNITAAASVTEREVSVSIATAASASASATVTEGAISVLLATAVQATANVQHAASAISELPFITMVVNKTPVHPLAGGMSSSVDQMSTPLG
jgi:hypothetical protein